MASFNKNSKTYLDYLQSTHASFIHAHGLVGTNVLLAQLPPLEQEKVLELGCGTGATLVKIKKQYPNIQLTGIDISEAMLQKAKQRLRFCGLGKQVQLLHLSEQDSIASNSINVIYAESVLGIIEGDALQTVLTFLKRVLHPNGILIVNETIWLASTNLSEIDAINRKAKALFGIIQCRKELHSVSGCQAFFEQAGFCLLETQEIQPDSQQQIHLKTYRSDAFTLFGRLRAYCSSKIRRKKRFYNNSINTFFETDKAYMRGVLFKFEKMKQNETI